MELVVRRIPRLPVALVAALLALAPAAAGIALAVPPPSAVDDTSWSTDEDTSLTIDAPGVLENDGTPGVGNVLCVASTDTSNLHGSLDWHADGSFTYTPAANYHDAGSANSFTYTMYEVADGDPCQGNPGSTATVEITVTSVNDPPTAKADSFQGLKNTTLIIGAPGVLANDSDIDGDSLTAVSPTNPAHGTLVLAANGGFSYTPNANFTGSDSFSYRASDGQATSAPRVVTITVSTIPPINTPTPPPAPTPAPTPEPTLTPIFTPPVEVTLEPGASPTEFVPPTPQLTGLPTAAASAESLAPGVTPEPGTTADGGGGSPLTIFLGIVLLALIIGAAAALWGPGWMARRRGEA